MSLQTQARAVLAAIMARHPAGVAAVTVGTESADGFVGSRRGLGDLDMTGETGATTQTVWVDAAAITVLPERGSTISVGGNPVIVLAAHRDPLSGVLAIEHQLTRPITTG